MDKRRSGKTADAPLAIFDVRATGKGTLQQRIRQKVIDAILAGIYPPGRRLPSSRKLSKQLRVSRNTVVLAYQQLIAEGYLAASRGSGIYVSEGAERRRLVGGAAEPPPATQWTHRLKNKLPELEAYRYPPDWQKYPFPFLEGRFDRTCFPVAEWREAIRLTLGVREIEQWSADAGEADDPLLVEQIRSKVLPRRGIHARADEILITLGVQQGLHLVAEVLVGRGTRVAIEEPGHVAMRELLSARGAHLIHQAIDREGMLVDDGLNSCSIAYVTPSHQRPTAATMSLGRRRNLLQKASDQDFIIIEDDYECETNYLDDTFPALRGMPGGERVVYVGNLSRVLAPGLRLGFIAAAPELISEARRLRALTTRHPPLFNQRSAALFLSMGHYDKTMLRMGRIFRERLIALRDALNHYRPRALTIAPVRGGTTYWVSGPEGLDARELAKHAAMRGVLIEPVGHYYARESTSANVFRMGITGIALDRIRPGVAVLTDVIGELVGGSVPEARKTHWLKGAILHRKLAGATLLYKTVYGDPCTIELHEDPHVADGQKVQVIVKTLNIREPWGEGLKRCAGIVADENPQEDDKILDEIYRERKTKSHREVPE